MTTKNQNFEMYAGNTKNIVVTVADVNLTGATVKWAMKKTIYDAEPAVAKTTAAGIAVTDATTGIFTVTLFPADTRNLSGTYQHEAEITDAPGNVSTVLTGQLTIHLSAI